jgi:beta-1,2-mannosidase
VTLSRPGTGAPSQKGKPFFEPQLAFEKSGQYRAGTVFVEGLVLFQNQWYLYYGTADTYVGAAAAPHK